MHEVNEIESQVLNFDIEQGIIKQLQEDIAMVLKDVKEIDAFTEKQNQSRVLIYRELAKKRQELNQLKRVNYENSCKVEKATSTFQRDFNNFQRFYSSSGCQQE